MPHGIRLLLTAIGLSLASGVQATRLSFDAADFTLNPTFSNVQAFSVSIDITGPLLPGATYSNPSLDSVSINVSGNLDNSPSGFPGFNLMRSMSGTEFYSQGSTIAFTVSALADLSDGLQVSDLTAAPGQPVLVINAREINTGRYHPPLLQLFAGGSGSIQNSNNTGGINPASNEEVNVDYGEEYVTELTFDPAMLDVTPEDTDGDGVAQSVDNCPLVANPSQFNLDNTGGGDLCDFDDDGDGVDDVFDNCPRIPNPSQLDSDDDGRGDACTGLPPGC